MLRDSLFSFVSTCLRLLTGLVLFVILAKAWGPERFGTFMFPFAVAGVLVKLVDYGFVLQLSRDLGRSRGREQVVVGEALAAKLLLLVPTLLLAAALTPLFKWGDDGPLLLGLLLLDAVILSFATVLQVPLRAVGRFDAETRIVLGANVALFGAVMLVVARGGGPVAAATAFVATRLLHCALAWQATRVTIGGAPTPRFHRAAIRSTLWSGLPFGVHAAVGTLNMQVDTLVVQHYLGAEGVGLYQAGMRIVLGALLVADALNNVYLARLARTGEAPEEFARLGRKMTRHLVALGVLAFAFATGAADTIVTLLFAPEYAPLVRLLPAFGVLTLIRYVGTPYGTFLTLGDRQGIRVVGVAIVFVASLALNVVLVPRFGLAGALVSTIVGHVLLYLVYAVAARLDRGSLLLDRRTLVLLATAAAAAVATAGTASAEHRLWLAAVLVSASVFLGPTRTEWRTVTSRLTGTG